VNWRAGFGLVIGLALVAGSVGRGLAAWAARPAHSVVYALGRGVEPDPALLLAGTAALERSAQWSGASARVRGHLALLQLERARRAYAAPGVSLPLIEAGVAAQRVALAAAPARGSGWARLVYAQDLRAQALEKQALEKQALEAQALEKQALGKEALKNEALKKQALWAVAPVDSHGGPDAGGAQAEGLLALEMAFLTRDLSFSLVRFRLDAALARWKDLRPWLRNAARAEVLELTRYGARGMDALVELYLGSPQHWVIDEELAVDPAQRAYFEKRLARRSHAG